MMYTIFYYTTSAASLLLILAGCYGAYLSYRQRQHIPSTLDRWDRRILYYLVRFGRWAGLLREFDPKDIDLWLKEQEKKK